MNQIKTFKAAMDLFMYFSHLSPICRLSSGAYMLGKRHAEFSNLMQAEVAFCAIYVTQKRKSLHSTCVTQNTHQSTCMSFFFCHRKWNMHTLHNTIKQQFESSSREDMASDKMELDSLQQPELEIQPILSHLGAVLFYFPNISMKTGQMEKKYTLSKSEQ